MTDAGELTTVIENRVADRMRRAWAQLLREMDSEGLPAPNGASILISEEHGDLTVTADVTGLPRTVKPNAKPPRAPKAAADEDDAGLTVRRGPVDS
jgi:hypothetical protein